MSGYTYIAFEPGVWTVGCDGPGGKWVPESDHKSEKEAAARVHYLNGGGLDHPEGLLDIDARRVAIVSLRDHFAGCAMQAMFNGFGPGQNTAPDVYYVCAREAYAVADAMLAERDKHK